MELDGTSCALAVDDDTSDTDNMAMILTTRLITADNNSTPTHA
jgi:hypothetical protein